MRKLVFFFVLLIAMPSYADTLSRWDGFDNEDGIPIDTENDGSTDAVSKVSYGGDSVDRIWTRSFTPSEEITITHVNIDLRSGENNWTNAWLVVYRDDGGTWTLIGKSAELNSDGLYPSAWLGETAINVVAPYSLTTSAEVRYGIAINDTGATFGFSRNENITDATENVSYVDNTTSIGASDPPSTASFSASANEGYGIILRYTVEHTSTPQTYYVTQGGALGRTGADLANAWSLANFIDSANWSSTESASAIDPGDTVYLCDAFTGYINLPSNVGGVQGLPILLRLDHSTNPFTMSRDNTAGNLISFYQDHYITLTSIDDNDPDQPLIDGLVTATPLSATSSIDSTIPAYSAIVITESTGITINNLEIQNVQNGIGGDDARDLVITDNYIHQAVARGINLQRTEVFTISGNEIYQATYKTVSSGVYNGVSADVYMNDCAIGIIKENELHATDDTHDGWGQIAIAPYGSRYLVIEDNSIHDHGSMSKRPPIHFKAAYQQTFPGGYALVRGNHIYDEVYNSTYNYTSSNAALYASHNNQEMWITQNKVNDGDAGFTIGLSWTYAHADNTNGYHPHDFYIWGNVFANNSSSSVNISAGASNTTGNIYDVLVAKNSTYKGGSAFTTSLGSRNYGDAGASDPVIKVIENLFVEGHYGDATIYNVYIKNAYLDLVSSWLDVDENGHYVAADSNSFDVRSLNIYTQAPSTLCYSSPCAYDSAAWPAAWFVTPVIGDPAFFDAANSDLRLTASSTDFIDGGTLLADTIPSMYMPYYSWSAIAFDVNDVLGPTTDWSTHPPSIVTFENSNELGAYGYSAGGDSTAPTLSSATIDPTGEILTLVFSEACENYSGFTITPSLGAAAITYSSGDGTSSYVFSIGRPILESGSETVTIDYVAGDVDDLSANALVGFSGTSVTNGSTHGDSGYTCEGQASTACTPDAFTSEQFGNDNDRVYTRSWTADENGTIATVRASLDEGGDTWDQAWMVVYVNNTLVAYSEGFTTISEGWNEYALTPVSGQTLNFENTDVIKFGVAWDNDDATDVYMDADVNETTDLIYVEDEAWGGDSTIPPTGTWTTSGSFNGLAVILKYIAAQAAETPVGVSLVMPLRF